MNRLLVLQEKPWFVQLAVFGLVGIMLYVGFWYMFTKSTRTETQEILEQVAKLQQDNARAQIASQRLNEFKVAYSRAQADYDDLKALLPEQRELTTVLQGIQDRSRATLSLRRFMPKEDEAQDFYSSKSIDVEVSGAYNNVGAFFAQMASYQRIVSIPEFKIKGLDDKDQKRGKTVDAQFKLKAYYASAEKLQGAPPPAPGGAVQPANGAVVKTAVPPPAH